VSIPIDILATYTRQAFKVYPYNNLYHFKSSYAVASQPINWVQA